MRKGAEVTLKNVAIRLNREKSNALNVKDLAAIVGEGLIIENAVKTGENYPIIYADDNASIKLSKSVVRPSSLEVHKVYAKDAKLEINASVIYASITMYNTKFKIDNTTVDYNASNTLSIKEKSKGSMYNNLIKGGDVKDNIPCVFVKESEVSINSSTIFQPNYSSALCVINSTVNLTNIATSSAKIYDRAVVICTPFTGQTGERGIIMRYSFEFKLECIEMYERGEFPDTPDGVSTKRFRDNIRQWKRMVDSSGIDSLHHKPQNRKWKPEEKLELIVKVLAGESCTFVALSNGIQPGMLYQWVNKYKTLGYNGLEESKKGRPPKDKNMKKNNKTHAPKLNETEYEELIRLRAENEHIKTEIEVIKKSIALRREKWAAQLEAKKQRSSKNL